MNDQERVELERLKERHARLEQEVRTLSTQLKVLEQTLSAPRGQAETISPAQITLPPVIPDAARSQPPLRFTPETRPLTGGAPRADIISKPSDQPTEAPASRSAEPVSAALPPAIAARKPEPQPLAASEPGLRSQLSIPGEARPDAGSFELRLGTFWLVRIGVVMVLTALAFFGNLAYQKMGAPGRIGLLYFTSAVLLGAGAWWQRKAARDSLQNYAQVLFAGGLAAVYFTTYAAHHIEHLRVIASPLLDGLLLLCWAGFMAWIADRKRSEVLALFAVGLAYYTSIITRVGSFTLYSNLVLALAAVFFLVRNRWAVLSFASLTASYAAYVFWRFFDGSAWHWASPEEGLWNGTCFLASYWLVFTSGVFLSRDEKFAGANRASFLTLNNGAFFTMFFLTMLQVKTGGFWKFSLIYGSALLVLAEGARRFLSAEPLAKNAYLTQGLLLVTVGLVSKFTGMQLALVLGAESVILLTLGLQRQSALLRIAAAIAGGLAIGWSIDGMQPAEPIGLYLGMALGAFMLVNTLLVARKFPESAALRPEPAFFSFLALLAWLVTTWNYAPKEHFAVVLGVEAVLVSFSFYLLRVRELSIFGQGYLMLAAIAWLSQAVAQAQPVIPWDTALLVASALVLSHWLQRQQVLAVSTEFGQAFQALYALAIVGFLYFWIGKLVTPPSWLALSTVLAIGIAVYGVATRLWFLAAFGQLFMLVSAVVFASQISLQEQPAFYLALVPISGLLLLAYSTVRWFQLKPDPTARISTPLLQAALAYRVAALAMSIWWVFEYIPQRECIWVLAAIGLALFVLAGWRRITEQLYFSGAFAATALIYFWLPLDERPLVYWPNLLAIISLAIQQQVAKQMPERYRLDRYLHGTVIIVAGLSVWQYVSQWVMQNASGFYLTASWSALALALFTCGIASRERIYRWLGLGVLGCALGRVVIFDVWKLETLYRILSFMALGVVLLVLGFIYNKYQEKIRQWL
jgi:uncharacterized membrane protein